MGKSAMRTRAAGPLLVCTCLSLVALHAADGPQVAYVTSDKTIVRSGPGEEQTMHERCIRVQAPPSAAGMTLPCRARRAN